MVFSYSFLRDKMIFVSNYYFKSIKIKNTGFTFSFTQRVNQMNRNAFIILALFISASVISFTAVKSDQLSLVISLALSSIPADGDQHPAFFITVVDSTGKPYLLPSP